MKLRYPNASISMNNTCPVCTRTTRSVVNSGIVNAIPGGGKLGSCSSIKIKLLSTTGLIVIRTLLNSVPDVLI